MRREIGLITRRLLSFELSPNDYRPCFARVQLGNETYSNANSDEKVKRNEMKRNGTGRDGNARLGFRSEGFGRSISREDRGKEVGEAIRRNVFTGMDRNGTSGRKNRDDLVVVRGRDSESGAARGETHYRRVPIPPTRCHVSRRCAHPPPISNRNVAKSNFRVRL